MADAIEYLSRGQQHLGGTFHLAAGPEGVVTIGELAELCRQYFGGGAPRYIAPDTFMRWIRPVVDLFIWGRRRRVIRAGGAFFVPYFDGNPIFDVTESSAALKSAGIKPPRVRDYIEVLFDYCVETDFGRRPPKPPGRAQGAPSVSAA